MSDPGVGTTVLTVTSDQAAQAAAFDPAILHSVMPTGLAEILTEVVRIVAVGNAVTIGSMPAELTTTSAADLLGISRPALMTLVREGQIAACKVGAHTRLNTADVLGYRERLREQQRAALQELRDFEETEALPEVVENMRDAAALEAAIAADDGERTTAADLRRELAD